MKNKFISIVSLLCAVSMIAVTTSCVRRLDGDTAGSDTLATEPASETSTADERTEQAETSAESLETEPPATEPPQTQPPATEPPQTQLPVSDTPPAVSGNTVISGGITVNNADYAGYDNTLHGWGPGGAVNDRNQPAGSVMYNNQYGSYDAMFMADGDKNIYLTFDEGYENGYTESILNTLHDKGVKAVFFVTYDYVTRNPELVKRIIGEGHVLGNHSMKHKSMPSLAAAEAAEEIAGLHKYVKDNFGYEMNLFRPPMGEFSERTLAVTRDLGYKSVFWSFAYRDWVTDDQPDPAYALDKATSALHPGAIYLLHAVSSTNAQILGQLIDNARAAGYVISGFYQ